MKNISYGLLIVICLGGISFAEVPSYGQNYLTKKQVPTHGWRYLSKDQCKLLYSEGTRDCARSGGRERIDSLKAYSKARATEILARYSIRHPNTVEEGAYCFEGGYKDEQSMRQGRGINIYGGERFYEEFWRVRRSR